VAVRYYNDGTDFRLADKGRVAEWLRRVTEAEGFALGAVNYIFCSPERHLEINRSFLGHDWATDVITFDYTGARPGDAGRGVKLSGDIFIDPRTVADNARALCVSPAVEMRRVIVHGVLHLCGHGDKTPREERAMRAREDLYLRRYYGGDRTEERV